MVCHNAAVRLIVVHNHFRPGGVRRVIELGIPCLLRALRWREGEVVLASGESIEADWLRGLRNAVRPAEVRSAVEPALAYVAEQRGAAAHIQRRIRRFLHDLLAGKGDEEIVCWAHNQGLGRNLILTKELEAACVDRNLRLVLHHHDWWFDNRWERWGDMRRSGFSSLATIARVVFCGTPAIRHVAINQGDAAILKHHLGERAGWVPNPAGRHRRVSRAAVGESRKWLAGRCGVKGPVWLMPCRLLRRKNIAEALLLARWLRPEAWLVSTAGVSSEDERDYARRLAEAAGRNGWKLKCGVLDRVKDGPAVAELIAASEAVVLTSLQEGFGLTYLEAALHRRPLVCRALPNIMPDLARFGFHFPQSYGEIRIAPGLFDRDAEVARQRRLFGEWRQKLPRSCRQLVQRAWLTEAGQSVEVPFSRLTLTAQLEVLSAPVERSWELCLPLNPFLGQWRELASGSRLVGTEWPATAERHLGEAGCTQSFRRVLAGKSESTVGRSSAVAAQNDFIRQRLAADNLYPLTWSPMS